MRAWKSLPLSRGGAERSEAERFCLPRLYPTFRLKGRLTAENHEDQTVEDAGDGAVDDDGAGDDEHFRGHAGDEALCLCQDRDEGNFCPILLGFWLLKFLKKSAFFAKLL